jgi:hypothetical protein
MVYDQTLENIGCIIKYVYLWIFSLNFFIYLSKKGIDPLQGLVFLLLN